MASKPKNTGRGEEALPRGIYAASLTPQNDDLSIDHDTLAAHCNWLLGRGCDGIALFGTTGEAASFSVDERTQALEFVTGAGVPLQRLLIGTGCCALPDTIALTRHAAELGVGGVLVVPPFFYKSNEVFDEGVFRVYDSLIREVGETHLGLFLYHYPQMSGVSLSKGLIGRLVDAFPETVVGIKDSSGDWENTRSLCESFPQLAVYPGTEMVLLDALRAGGAGCISATFNVSTRPAADICTRWAGEDVKLLQERLSSVRRVFDAFPLIAALKHVMYRHSQNPRWLNMRPPLTPLGREDSDRLERSLDAEGFTVE